MEYRTLTNLRREHPGWRLLTAANAPMIVSFLHRCFIAPNLRTLAQQELASRLEDYLYALRRQIGDDAFPRPALHYLDDWASDGSGWLRKYYPAGSDEPHYDITPATERAIDWLAGLQRRQFVGTESRLMTVFALLREMTEGTETDPLTRIAELEKRKAAIEAEIRRIRDGHLELMDATAVRDRFQQMAGTARSLLGDFREVEQNFRDLDRAVRERIATWNGAKGALLAEIFGERDAIADSDQGRSFRAFWDFLMSPSRQEELSALFDAVFALDPVKGLAPDPRLLRIHFDWLEAGEVTQRTVARLSEQLRRYLDDQAWLENRRIMQILHGIEQQALEVRDTPPAGPFMELDDPAPEIRLPMERTLFAPPQKPRIADRDPAAGDADVPADALFGQVTVDRARLAAQVRRALQTRDQVSLADLVAAHPLERGLAELVAYLSLAAEDGAALIDDGRTQTLSWTDPAGSRRRATLPLVIFSRAGRPAGSAAP
jgi:hypothetical protein